jgi:uncharacterized protein YjbI with pentapeptide repeats
MLAKQLFLLLCVSLVIAIFACLIGFAPIWTGFGGKTLWDWMSLILIPAVIAGGGTWYKSRQERLARDLEDRRREEERYLEDQRREQERALQRDRLREDALQQYLDRMTELMLKEGLRASEPREEVSSIARARTLTVLRELDSTRKGSLLLFLVESDLIPKSNRVVTLQDADLREADLHGANLIVRMHERGGEENEGGEGNERTVPRRADVRRANSEVRERSAFLDLPGVSLRGADLRKANLRGAKLKWADLFGANLAAADLTKARLGQVDLRQADMTGACLREADLGGAILKRAIFCNANLRCAKFGDADLEKTEFAGADLSGADLKHVKNLTQEQLESARGDENVKLRPGLVAPASWVSRERMPNDFAACVEDEAPRAQTDQSVTR